MEDPEQLPFAPHVTNHTLVEMLNRGLLYHSIEREELPKVCGPPDSEQLIIDVSVIDIHCLQLQDAVIPVSGFFGPLRPESPAADEEFENARKRQNDSEPSQAANGPASKKIRLSNGTAHENGFDNSSNLMDIDRDDEQNGDENAYPSPEQAPSPMPMIITDGPNQGTQVEKVHDLAGETTFLDLSDDPARNANTVLLQCEFNPQDPTFLAAAGTDALARMWTLSHVAPDSGSVPVPESPGKPKFAPHVNLLDESMPLTTTTTGLSWSSDGATIAVSSEPNDDGVAKVEFWHTDGRQFASYNNFESPIICLKWNFENTACLAISPGNDNTITVITVMFPGGATHRQYSIPTHSLRIQVLEAAWTQNDVFVLSGGDMLKAYQCSEEEISPVKKFETREGHALSKVVFDERSRLLATASDTGNIDVS